jgi:hypothetical protein
MSRSCSCGRSTAVESKDSVEECAESGEYQRAGADPAEHVGTQRTPKANAEQHDQDPCQVVADLVVDPRPACRQRPQIRGVVIGRAVGIRLR